MKITDDHKDDVVTQYNLLLVDEKECPEFVFIDVRVVDTEIESVKIDNLKISKMVDVLQDLKTMKEERKEAGNLLLSPAHVNSEFNKIDEKWDKEVEDFESAIRNIKKEKRFFVT